MPHWLQAWSLLAADATFQHVASQSPVQHEAVVDDPAVAWQPQSISWVTVRQQFWHDGLAGSSQADMHGVPAFGVSTTRVAIGL